MRVAIVTDAWAPQVNGVVRTLDAVTQELTPEDGEFLTATLARYGVTGPPSFKKIVAGRRLWRSDKKEFATWREAL